MPPASFVIHPDWLIYVIVAVAALVTAFACSAARRLRTAGEEQQEELRRTRETQEQTRRSELQAARNEEQEMLRLKRETLARTRPINVENLPRLVMEMHANSGAAFKKEYEDIESLSPRYPSDDAERPENVSKNLHADILPFDHTRVKLKPSMENPVGYINASYLQGICYNRGFIAAQVPLMSTKDDFWRMVWEHCVTLIVLLTKVKDDDKETCALYWPKTTEEICKYGTVSVTGCALPDVISNDYIIKHINVKHQWSRDFRRVIVLCYKAWPDNGYPASRVSIISFISAFRNYADIREGPTLVMCSDGVGRTGTFICLCRMLEMIKTSEPVDVFNTLLEMRDFRMRLVQTWEQYASIYDCLRDELMRGRRTKLRTQVLNTSESNTTSFVDSTKNSGS